MFIVYKEASNKIEISGENQHRWYNGYCARLECDRSRFGVPVLSNVVCSRHDIAENLLSLALSKKHSLSKWENLV